MNDASTPRNETAHHFRPDGDLTATTAAPTRTALEQALQTALHSGGVLAGGAHPRVFVIDLKQVDAMDSTGLSLLINASQRLERNGFRLVVTNASEEIRALLHGMRLDRRFVVQGEPEPPSPGDAEAPA